MLRKRPGRIDADMPAALSQAEVIVMIMFDGRVGKKAHGNFKDEIAAILGPTVRQFLNCSRDFPFLS